MEALAFAPDGTLYAGTQCDGVAIARPADDYAAWETTTASRADRVETEPVGKGLPSDQCNDVLVHSDGTVYVAMVRGLARSADGGGSWTYTRGRDYADKVKRRFEGPPPRWKPVGGDLMKLLLPEDYVTTLAEAPDGKLWIGFRQQGLMIFDPATNETEEMRTKGSDLTEDFVTAAAPTAGGTWVGTYGGSVVRMDAPNLAGLEQSAKRSAVLTLQKNPAHPASATSLTVAELKESAAGTKVMAAEGDGTMGAFVGEDWQTKGDWFGRLGRSRAMLCAMASPTNHDIGDDSRTAIRGHVGPHHKKGELLRHWCHRPWWDDRRVLYNPIIGYRRQASWDDHAEAYPISYEGPDVWVEFDVPHGLHQVAFYFFNKDGHRGRNRYRDYLLELRTGPGPDAGLNRPMPPSIERRGDLLASARVREFWGGVWQCFAVHGPGTYRMKIGCNDSYNTIVSAVCIDRITGASSGWERSTLPYSGSTDYSAPDPSLPPASEKSDTLIAAETLMSACGEHAGNMEVYAQRPTLLLSAYRAAHASTSPANLLANLRWQVRLWTDEDRSDFDEAIDRLWKNHILINPHLSGMREAHLRMFAK